MQYKGKTMYDYLIVGAGLYGSVFAHEMTRAGKRCLVIDRRPHIAGNAYTENIHGINDYAGYGDNSVRHSIWTKYDLNIKNLTKVEGDPDPTLTATLDILNSNPNNKLNSSIFSLKRAAGEQPGDYAITAEANKE